MQDASQARLHVLPCTLHASTSLQHACMKHANIAAAGLQPYMTASRRGWSLLPASRQRCMPGSIGVSCKAQLLPMSSCCLLLVLPP